MNDYLEVMAILEDMESIDPVISDILQELEIKTALHGVRIA